MAYVKINTAFNVHIQFELAGMDKRFFAWLIDLVIRFIIYLGMFSILRRLFNNPDVDFGERLSHQMTLVLVSFIPIFFYFFLFETFLNGQSIGKKLLNIRVVSLEGYKPTATQYLSRWCFRLVDLGFISLLFLGQAGVYTSLLGLVFIIPNIFAIIYFFSSSKEQRFGDLVSGTVVIKLNSKTQLSDTIFEHVSKEYNVVYPNVLKLSDRDITIIKNALQNFDKSGNDTTLWLIAEKLKQVLDFKEIGDPYHVLDSVLKDYNYLSAN
jgi:uncharacterized RDD family membrane protein YckC